MNRHADADEYHDHHILNFPESSETYWYTDGGTLDNEPLGRTLDIAGELDRHGTGPRRLLLLIHPHPTAAPSGLAWADPDRQPSWVETLVRAQRLQTTQSIYDDLRHADKTNRRIETLDDLARQLTDALRDAPQRAALEASLAQFLEDADQSRAARGAPALAPSGDLVRDALGVATGLSGKRKIGIEVLSPLLLSEVRGEPGKPGRPVEDVLAGEFLFHFGGFAREALRQQDFDLGYRTVLEWFERDRPLESHGLDVAADETALAAAGARYRPPTGSPLGKIGFKTLSGMEKLRFADLLRRMALTVWHGWRHPTHQ